MVCFDFPSSSLIIHNSRLSRFQWVFFHFPSSSSRRERRMIQYCRMRRGEFLMHVKEWFSLWLWRLWSPKCHTLIHNPNLLEVQPIAGGVREWRKLGTYWESGSRWWFCHGSWWWRGGCIATGNCLLTREKKGVTVWGRLTPSKMENWWPLGKGWVG